MAHRSSVRRMLIALLGTFIGGLLTIALDARQDGPTRSGSRPALFTEAQARTGEAVYTKACASCHGATLTGGTAPPLTGPRFANSCSDPRVTLDDLFFIIRTTMPPGAISTLSPQERAAVFAYILRSNGYAAGQAMLTADSPQLKQQRFEPVATQRAVTRTE